MPCVVVMQGQWSGGREPQPASRRAHCAIRSIKAQAHAPHEKQCGVADVQEAGKGSERPKGDAWARFACGLAAGTLAKLATNPLDVAKKRYQIAGLQRSTM